MKHPDLSNIRGMSNPVFFSFNTLDKGRRMVCHAVLFTSFEIAGGSEAEMMIGGLEDDPRGKAFLKYVWDNFLEEQRKKLVQRVEELEKMIADNKSSVAELSAKIEEIRKQANEQI